MMKKKSILGILMALMMGLACLTGCSQTTAEVPQEVALSSGGVLVLRVNPEIAVEYDENGLVTGVSARNDDALAIISSCEGLIGQEARTAVTSLVTAIGEAGYFVEEVEGERRQITIEIEAGSQMPHETFLDEVVSDVRDCVSANRWAAPLNVENESDYGLTDYVDTDYGPDNDGFTDYDDTDYGPNNDGVTDYDDTDYGPNSDGVTDYSDYGTTGGTNNGNSGYGDSVYGDSGYTPPVTPPANTGGDSGYSNYGDADGGYSNYGGSDSGYSDYDSDSGYEGAS